MEIFVAFTFDASHTLPNTPVGHKCHGNHGHTFRAEVHATGEVGEKTGWVMDFGTMREICQPLIARLDHHYLNEIEGLENPTSENIAQWLWARLKPWLATLSMVMVQETPNTGAIYRGKEE